MASTLRQSQLEDASPAGHCNNGDRRWKEYVPRARTSRQSEEAPLVHSPVQSRKAETKTKSRILEIEEQEEPPATVDGAKHRDSVHKTEMKPNVNAKKTKRQAPPLQSFGLYFTEVTEARQKARGLDWPPHEDETLPNTKEERIAVVRKLFTAIQDTSDIQDKMSSPMLKKRWLAESAGESSKDVVGNAGETKRTQKIATNTVYKPWVKERLCWDILVSFAIAYAITGANMNKETTERIYREGAGFVSILDPVMIDRCEKSRKLTFEERISKLVVVLKSYKSRVDKLLRGGCVEEYVLCPDTLLQISSSNRQQNDERQKDLTAGRKREDRLVKKPGKKKQILAPTPATSRKRTRYSSEDASDMGPRDLSHHSKFPMMLRLHGSITPKLVIPVLLVGGWATAVTCISKLVYDLGTDQVFITVLGFVVSLALSVRSSTSMDRYFQGRQLWGRLRLASHILARLIWIHAEERHAADAGLGKQDLLGKVSCLNLIVAFAVAVKHKLRFEPGTHYEDLKHLVGHLDTFAQAADMPAPDPPSAFRRTCQLLGMPMATPNPRKHVKQSRVPLGDLPLEILSHLSAYMKVLYDNGTLRDYSIYQTQTLDSLTIMDEVSCGTERILNTPLPLAYSIAISQVTWLYILLLPFQCYNSLGWITIPACVVAAYIILGIAFIGREIEDPFGHDVNDLPLDAFCQQIRQDLDIIMSRAAPLVNDFMGREENMPLYPLSYLSTRAWANKSPDEIHVALSQKVGLHHPMVERGENPVPPTQGRLAGVDGWVEKGGSGPIDTTGHYRRKYGSV
ncbi:uncharacterized protein J4E92_000900 [Alternaria infectoria]|uniref:uncharacterized protein n=1 Tax=Alternaria infectoria TaxID=45303 RepID=UPI00221EC470|nr:uncharacterized protein J4E92_000900 [Alternaria infectoria]KAI4939614.1 hypothetical protein J4E92_000900 [Alternaria infectoria]